MSLAALCRQSLLLQSLLQPILQLQKYLNREPVLQLGYGNLYTEN
jgi:hypothetical protein